MRKRGSAVAAVASVVAVALLLPEPGINDWPFVLRHGRDLLDGGNPYTSTYPPLVGPLALAAIGVLGDYRVAAVAGALLLPLAVFRAAGITRRAAVAVAAAAVPWCAAGAVGHLDDQLAVALLVMALTTSGVVAGAWLALACAGKPFALFALPLVDWRGRAVTLAAAAIGVLAVWAISAAELALQSTTIQPGSPLALVMPAGGLPPPWWRMAELTVLLVIAAVAVRRVGPLRAALIAASARVALEPGDFIYYAAPLACLAACLAARQGDWTPLALSWVVMLGVAFPAPAVVRLVALAALALAALGIGRWSGPEVGDRHCAALRDRQRLGHRTAIGRVHAARRSSG